MAHLSDIQGHRGARALFPENTLEGFLAAARLGVKAFELDVGMTADGVLVVHHNPALDPDIARDDSGHWLSQPAPLIWSLSYGELRRYDVGRLRPGSRWEAAFPEQESCNGARVPTLASVLEALPDARFTIEVKTDPAHPNWTAGPTALADATLAVIDAVSAAGRVTVEAFDWRVQRHMRQVRPTIRLAWLTREETVRNAECWWDGVPLGRSVAEAVAAEGGPIWAPDYKTVTDVQVQKAHALGLTVLAWTVNDPADMHRLATWGVDGLITDRPDIALAELGGSQRVEP